MHDIAANAVLACLLEVSSHKPGNVNRYRDFKDTKFEHFLATSASFYKPAYEAAFRGSLSSRGKIDYSQIGIGYLIREAVERADKFHGGGNTNLGISILLIPLCAAAGSIMSRDNKIEIERLKDEAGKIIIETTYKDTYELFRAINIANAGGLRVVEEYDVRDKNSINDIIRNNISFYDIMGITERDTVAAEISNNYKITFETGYNGLMEEYTSTKDINLAILKTFFMILSEYPDSLIVKKTSRKVGEEISNMAKEILKMGLKKEAIDELDDYLRSRGNLYNPGTTADITAASIFVCLLGGLKL